MMLFEICPNCNMNQPITKYGKQRELKPMVLSGDDREMQCDVCNKSFKLPDCQAVKETARKQRGIRYAKKR